MAFEPVSASVVEGGKDILSLQKGMQEAAVRPRELEAATTIKEAQASSMKTQALQMQKIAGLEQASAKAMRDAGTEGDGVKQTEYLMKDALKNGMVGYANELKTTLEQQKLNSYKSLEAASKVTAAHNEETGSFLRSISSFDEANEFIQSKKTEAEEKARSGGTQQDAQELMKWRAAEKDLQTAQQSGDFGKYQKGTIIPFADAFDKRSTQAKTLHETNAAFYQEAKLELERQKLAERKKEEAAKLAAKRDMIQAKEKTPKVGTDQGAKELRANVALKNKLQNDLNKMEKEVADPASPWYHKGLRENPDYVEKQKLLKELEAGTKPGASTSPLEAAVTKHGWSYEPSKYDYRIGPDGIPQRKLK